VERACLLQSWQGENRSMKLANGPLIALLLFLLVGWCQGQQGSSTAGSGIAVSSCQSQPEAQPSGTQEAGDQKGNSQSKWPADVGGLPNQQQPKRILGFMPNFRAVSAGAVPPPPSLKQSFKIATQTSFDYSSFIFVGVSSALSEWTDGHPQLGEGFRGYGNYYWRGFVDKTDGNYWVIFILPTIFHQDERYYAIGKGTLWHRGFYAASRVFVTPNYHGHNGFNISELLGRAVAQGISIAYYPSQVRTPGALSQKYGYAVGRDALTNVLREFWPDIAVHVLHRHP
jgi:hypothetical protein